MANRSPTDEETKTYTERLSDELFGLIGQALRVAKTKAVLEGVFGPCSYSRLGPGKCQVTQLQALEGVELVQFVFNGDLDE